MLMRLECELEGVSDLSLAGSISEAWQLSCCHVHRSIRNFPTLGFYPSPTVSPLCRALRWRLQSSNLLDVATICLLGLCPTHLAGKFARHRSLPQCPGRSALSSGTARAGQAQHAGRCPGQSGLAHLRRLGATADPASPKALCVGTRGAGFEANDLRPGCQHHRFVFVGLPLGALRRIAFGPQDPHATGTALAFARSNTGQFGHFSGSSLARSTHLRAGGLLSHGSGVRGLAAALCHRTGSGVVCRARQEISELLPAALPKSGRRQRLAQRSNHQPARLLRRQKISGQIAASTVFTMWTTNARWCF